MPAYLKKHCTKAISEVLKKFEQTKEERDQALDAVKAEATEVIAGLKEDDAVRGCGASPNCFPTASALTKSDEDHRQRRQRDGRALDQVRTISAMAGVLPRMHDPDSSSAD